MGGLQHNRTIFLLSLAAFFSGAALRICDALIPRLARDFSITSGAAGRVIISFSVAYGLMQLVFGPMGDRFGKARVITFALCAASAGALASSLAPGFDSLVVLRILWGMGAAGVIPMSMALIGDTVPYAERQATLAKLLMGILSGMMAGQLAGGLFADTGPGWKGAFATLGVGYLIVAVLLARELRSPAGAHASSSTRLAFVRQLKSVVSLPWARVILLAVAIEGVLMLGPMAYLPSFLHARFGMSLSAAAGLLALYAVGGLLYTLVARRLVQGLGESRMVLTGGCMVGAAFFALWLSPVWVTAGPAAVVLGFGTYLYHNTLQVHATQMAPEVRGTGVATFAFCLFVGQAVGVSLSGAVLDGLGFPLLFLAPGIGLPLAGAWLARALRARAAA